VSSFIAPPFSNRPAVYDSTLAYAAAKAALASYSKGLCERGRAEGHTGDVISPGFMEASGAHG